jgi:hypothetical protein
MRQRRAIDTLGAEHVGVVDVVHLFWGERLGRTCHHVSGVVDDHVEAPLFFDDRRDGGVNRLLRRTSISTGFSSTWRDAAYLLSCVTASAFRLVVLRMPA